MKIGFFTDSYLPSHDGVATTVQSCATALHTLGHEIYIIAPSQPHQKNTKNVHRLVSVRMLKEPEIWVGLEVPQPELFKIAQIEFDIIHGHSGGPISLVGWQLAKMHSIPFIETYHTLWKYYQHYFPLHMVNGWMLRKVTEVWGNDCNALIAPSEKIKDELQRYGIQKPIYVLPNGIRIKDFVNQPKGFLHQTFAIPHDKKIVLTVGRLEPEKSIDFIIHAFALLQQSQSNTVLCIVGEGREKEKLATIVKKDGLGDSVVFTGAIEHTLMPKVYADSDLFLFASKTETQGMVIIESLASGVPVVAVQDKAFFDAVKDGENGFLIPKDKTLFAQKASELLENELLYASCARQAVLSAQPYDSMLTARVLVQIYEEVLFAQSSKPTHESPSRLRVFGRKTLPQSMRHIKKEYATFKAFLKNHSFS